MSACRFHAARQPSLIPSGQSLSVAWAISAWRRVERRFACTNPADSAWRLPGCDFPVAPPPSRESASREGLHSRSASHRTVTRPAQLHGQRSLKAGLVAAQGDSPSRHRQLHVQLSQQLKSSHPSGWRFALFMDSGRVPSGSTACFELWMPGNGPMTEPTTRVAMLRFVSHAWQAAAPPLNYTRPHAGDRRAKGLSRAGLAQPVDDPASKAGGTEPRDAMA